MCVVLDGFCTMVPNFGSVLRFGPFFSDQSDFPVRFVFFSDHVSANQNKAPNLNSLLASIWRESI